MKVFFLQRISAQRKQAIFFMAGFFISCFFCFFPLIVFAQIDGGTLDTVGEIIGTQESIGVVIARIIRAFLGILGIIAVCLIIYAGFLIMFAHGEESSVKKGVTILKDSLIGLFLILASYSITSFILSRLLRAVSNNNIQTTEAIQYTEPFSDALGSGSIENHYPERNAVDIPRNTNIMVTFKKTIDFSSLIEGYDQEENQDATNLNTTSVKIFPTEKGIEGALLAQEVSVTISEDQKTVVFDPLPLLGNAQTDTNYTVSLTSNILDTNGRSIFADSSDGGYEWTFEVSTEVDLTPPYIVSIVPHSKDDPYDRNITIQIQFNEAMDPVAGAGTYNPQEGKSFVNIETFAGDSAVSGTYRIGNNYKTIEFIPNDACGQDPCGDTIYCLPGSSVIEVDAHAAEVGSDPPQAKIYGASFNGLVDAAGNSLNGNKNSVAEGSPTDDYSWNFTTSNKKNDTIPKLTSISPSLKQSEVDVDQDIEINFNVVMQSSSLTTDSIKIIPDHDQTLWYQLHFETQESEDKQEQWTHVFVSHAPFWESSEEKSYYYHPLVDHQVKSSYQICFYPSVGPSSEGTNDCASSSAPYCCNGNSSVKPCTSLQGTVLE